MFENPFLYITIIAFSIIAVSIIFEFQVLSEILSGVRNWVRKKRGYEENSKVDEYLTRLSQLENERTANEINTDSSKMFKLHVLKIVNLNNRLLIYFLNKGSKASEIKLSSENNSHITIEPNNLIEENQSGCIKVADDILGKSYIKFELNFTDSNMNWVSQKYLVNLQENRMEEISLN